MIKQNLSGVTLIDKKGVRVNPNIHLGESDGYISGDILDANAVQGTVNLAVLTAKEDIEDLITDLIGSAPEVLDTLAELADAIGDDPDFFNTINNELDQKVDKVSGKGLSTNDYTTEEKNKLAGILAGAQVNPTNVSAFTNDAGYLTQHQSLSDYVQKSQTAGLIKNDGTIDTNVYLTQHQDISGKEDVTTIVAPVDATDATLPVTALTAEAGKYYRLDVPVETLAVTLPAMNAVESVKKVGIYLTAGTTPDVTITAADNKRVVFQNDYEINSGMTYEIEALFNGRAWVVTAVEIFIETKLVVYYDIQDISSPTTICSNYNNSVKSIEVDGVLLDSVVTTYQFNSVGEHVIKYEFNDPTTVGNNAPLFSGITTIKRAVIADTFTSISGWVFQYCTGLTSVTIGNGVTSIDTYAFQQCTGLTSITIPDNVTSIGNTAFYGCSGLTSVTIGSGVTSIGDAAFINCSSLTSITIPNGVTSIGRDAFEDCTDLTSVTIGSGVTSIGSEAFENCTGLTSIVVDSANTVYDSRNNCNAIINTSTNELIAGCKNTVIPNTVTSIGDGAFRCCTGLTSVTIPNSVTSIGQNAFYDCSGLVGITIPNSVTNIGGSAFSGCTDLTNINISSSVTSIDTYAFSGCTGLASITIPDSVTSIGDGVFWGCSSLTSITCNATTAPSIQNNTFRNVKTGGTLHVPAGNTGYDVWMQNTNYYLGLYGWTKVEPMNIITYEASAKLELTTSQYSIGLHTNAFSGTSGKLTMTSHTFENGIGTIEFNGDVTSIGEKAFYYCRNLTSITIPDSVTSIGQDAFNSCSGLTSITIPNNVTSIGPAAFYGCSGLTSITIPNNVTSIGLAAFQRCSGLTSVTIGSGVTSIGEKAFLECTGLISIISLAAKAPTIQSNTFVNVKTGGTLTVPSGSTGYDVWMGTGNYYLGKLGWTKVEQ